MTTGGEALDLGTSLDDDVGKQGGSDLLGLEMTGFNDQQIRMTEPGMVVNLACEICAHSQRFGFGYEVAA